MPELLLGRGARTAWQHSVHERVGAHLGGKNQAGCFGNGTEMMFTLGGERWVASCHKELRLLGLVVQNKRTSEKLGVESSFCFRPANII